MKKVCVCVPSLLVESSPMLHALPFADVSRLLHAFVGPTLSSLVLYLVHIVYKQYMSIDGSFDVIHNYLPPSILVCFFIAWQHAPLEYNDRCHVV